MRDEPTANLWRNRPAIARFVLWTLAVCVFNAAVHFAGYVALFALFEKNYLLAALPGLVVVAAVACQPWLLLQTASPVLGMIPFLRVASPYLVHVLTATITVAVYGALNRRGKLEWIKRRNEHWRRHRHTDYVVGAIVLLLAACTFLGYTDAIPQNRGVPRALGYRMTGIATPDDSRYYVISNFLDSEYVWRATVPERDLPRIVKAVGMTSIKPDKMPPDFVRKPPLWWRPNVNGAQVYSTHNFPADDRGGDGWYACAVYEPRTEFLYVWIKDNF